MSDRQPKWLVFALLLLAIPAHAEVTAISEARDLPAETEITIQGRVTVPSGSFNSALSDEGFAVNDRTGGIFVCTGNTDYELRARRNVEIEGTMGDIHGMPCVVATQVDPIRRREIRLPTGNVPVSAVGSIVTVQGEVTRMFEDSNAGQVFGTKVFIDDGTGEREIFLGTGINLRRLRFLKVGASIRATGFVALFPGFDETTPEIDVRSHRDIRRAR